MRFFIRCAGIKIVVRAILKLDVQMQTAEIMVESFRVVKFNNQKRASDRERNLLLILCVHCNIRQMLIHVIGMAFFMYEKLAIASVLKMHLTLLLRHWFLHFVPFERHR